MNIIKALKVLSKMNHTNMDFAFTHSPLMNKIHKDMISESDELQKALNKNLTGLFFKDLAWRIDHNKNYILVFWGATGIGKSTVAQAIGQFTTDYAKKKYNKKSLKTYGRSIKFNSDNVCFSRSELLNSSQYAIRYETLIFDEDDRTGFMGTGGFREYDEMTRLEKQVRGDQLNFIFCSPLLEDEGQHASHYVLQSFDIDYKLKLNRSIIYTKDENRMNEPKGYILTPLHWVKGYDEKKKNHIAKLKSRTLADRYMEYEKVATIMLEKYNIMEFDKTSWKYIIRKYFPRFVDDELKDIVQAIKFMKGLSKVKKVKKDNEQQKP